MKRITRIYGAAILTGLVAWLPSTAYAHTATVQPSVALYTMVSLAAVITVAMVSLVALQLAYRLRFIGGDQQVQLVRRLRVGFGLTFLLAAVTPYLALNFSAATLVPFLAGAALIVIAWVWGASQGGNFDSELQPPTEA